MPTPHTTIAAASGAFAHLLETVDTMSPAELEALPYGLIQLDPTGRIRKFNAVESQLAALPRAEQIGEAFFTAVAPCTRMQAFSGRLMEVVAATALDTWFPFHFAFKQQPWDMTVRRFDSARTQSVRVMVADREGTPLREAACDRAWAHGRRREHPTHDAHPASIPRCRSGRRYPVGHGSHLRSSPNRSGRRPGITARTPERLMAPPAVSVPAA